MRSVIIGVVAAAIGAFLAFAIATNGRVPSTDEQSVYTNAEAAAAKLSTPVQ